MRKLISFFLILSFSNHFLFGQENFSFSEDRITLRDSSIIYINSDIIPALKIRDRLMLINSNNKDQDIFSSIYGLGVNFNYSDKFIFRSSFDFITGDYDMLIKDYKDSLNIYPLFGEDNQRFLLDCKYKFNNFIDIHIGNGTHFIGSGYQSLLLSDKHSPYPYLKLRTKFGKVKYYNLYSTFLNAGLIDYGRKKHAASHYLEFNLTDNINIGVFETVLWLSKIENDNRGYEFAYMNPIIFYRPVEFSQKSGKGNALMGLNFDATTMSSTLYGQFILDDLNISRQKDFDENYSSGFFQNKFGFQLGLKTSIKDLKFLIEYNQVQPYTYGHRTILQNYSHMNEALAHPLGANFKEIICVVEYAKKKWNYKIKIIKANIGLDSLDTHYGQDIFSSDIDASTGGQYSYGNYNGQGVLTNWYTVNPEITYSLKWADIFGSINYRRKKSNLLNQHVIWYSIGLRTYPFYYNTDY